MARRSTEFSGELVEINEAAGGEIAHGDDRAQKRANPVDATGASFASSAGSASPPGVLDPGRGDDRDVGPSARS